MEMSSFILNIFIELACSEQDIVVTASVWCMCVVLACRTGLSGP